MIQAKYATILSVILLGFVKYITVPDSVVQPIDLPEIASQPAPEAIVPASYKEPNYVPVLTTVSAQDKECLAQNIYFEAKNQTLRGQMAVGIVTLKRVVSSRFPNTICRVVKQARYMAGTTFPIRHKCQFSWYCDGKADRPVEPDAYAQAQSIAEALLSSESRIADFTHGADHYHADYITPPVWTTKMVKVTQIDNHIFYTTSL